MSCLLAFTCWFHFFFFKILLNNFIYLFFLQVILNEVQKFTFIIPIHDKQIRNFYQIRVTHDNFIVEDTIIPLSLYSCILPDVAQGHTGIINFKNLHKKCFSSKQL